MPKLPNRPWSHEISSRGMANDVIALTTRSDPDHWRGVQWGGIRWASATLRTLKLQRGTNPFGIFCLSHPPCQPSGLVMKNLALLAFVGCAASTSAFTINFVNRCGSTIWPAVGKAPNGQPDPSVAFGTRLDPGQSASFGVADTQIGIRAWGRTGCDASGANCQTGACNGGLVCNDGGITSGVILSEYGYADFGQYGGERTSWDLSHVSASINIDTQLSSSDGQSVLCRASNCPADQAYDSPTDYAADRNSPLGQTFTHTFCP